MNFLELFAGIGGMSYGLTQAGWECVGYVECDTKCTRCKTYTKHLEHESKPFYTVCAECGKEKYQQTHHAHQLIHDPLERKWHKYDVTAITDDDIRLLRKERGRIELIAAGFPCQTFSTAGKRQGFADTTRGTLFFEVVRFASILKPKYLLLENVDGLRNHDKGRTLGIILSTLYEMGYEFEYQVLNSKSYIPQNRERIFIVGHLRGQCTRKIFPIIGQDAGSINVIGRLEGNHDQNSRVYGTNGLAPTLSTMQGGGQEPKIMVVGSLQTSDAKGTNSRQWVYDTQGIIGCLSATDHKQPKQILVKEATTKGYAEATPGDSVNIQFPNSNTRRGGVGKGIANTLEANGINQGVVTESLAIRKLTPLECFRLQTYPVGWYVLLKLYKYPEYIKQIDLTRNDITRQVLDLIKREGLKEGFSDSSLYKMAGNGVTSAVAADIGKRLLQGG